MIQWYTKQIKVENQPNYLATKLGYGSKVWFNRK